jgi:enolase
VKKVVDLAKKNSIKTIMSHRSGETMDYTLADLAFAFQTDYIKTGVVGKERDVKLRRLIEIENSLS